MGLGQTLKKVDTVHFLNITYMGMFIEHTIEGYITDI